LLSIIAQKVLGDVGQPHVPHQGIRWLAGTEPVEPGKCGTRERISQGVVSMLDADVFSDEVKGLREAKENMERQLREVTAELESLDEELRKEAPLAEDAGSGRESFHHVYELRAQKRKEQETLESAIHGIDREISARHGQVDGRKHEGGEG
jgi:hypothetical protein